jgi:hypothetical protein
VQRRGPPHYLSIKINRNKPQKGLYSTQGHNIFIDIYPFSGRLNDLALHVYVHQWPPPGIKINTIYTKNSIIEMATVGLFVGGD